MTDQERVAFERLSALAPAHPYWKNQWMFTQPVFSNESRQGQDPAAFWRWAKGMPTALRKYIMNAPVR